MLISEVDEFIDNWPVGEVKVFTLKYDFFAPDIIIITRRHNDIFEIDQLKSTTKSYGEFTKDQMLIRLRNSSLIYKPYSSAYIDYNSERSGDCTCGAYATLNPEHHAYYCRRSSK